MACAIKEIRESTKMTQKEFAMLYGIPLSTLRKWEQQEASPAPYVVKLIAKSLPGTDYSLRRIKGKNNKVYYYDRNKKMVSDVRGNWIAVSEDLDEIKEQNLVLYLEELFEDFYEICDRFNRNCSFDKKEDIIWS